MAQLVRNDSLLPNSVWEKYKSISVLPFPFGLFRHLTLPFRKSGNPPFVHKYISSSISGHTWADAEFVFSYYNNVYALIFYYEIDGYIVRRAADQNAFRKFCCDNNITPCSIILYLSGTKLKAKSSSTYTHTSSSGASSVYDVPDFYDIDGRSVIQLQKGSVRTPLSQWEIKVEAIIAATGYPLSDEITQTGIPNVYRKEGYNKSFLIYINDNNVNEKLKELHGNWGRYFVYDVKIRPKSGYQLYRGEIDVVAEQKKVSLDNTSLNDYYKFAHDFTPSNLNDAVADLFNIYTGTDIKSPLEYLKYL